jgi:hypothetical protein
MSDRLRRGIQSPTLYSQERGTIPKYRVTIHALLPPADDDSEVRLSGFYVTRAVTARNLQEAGATAIRLLQAEPKYRKMVEGYQGRIPELVVDEAVVAQDVDVKSVNHSGYAFYEDE